MVLSGLFSTFQPKPAELVLPQNVESTQRLSVDTSESIEGGWKSALRRLSNTAFLPEIPIFTPGPSPQPRRLRSSSGESSSGGDADSETERPFYGLQSGLLRLASRTSGSNRITSKTSGSNLSVGSTDTSIRRTSSKPWRHSDKSVFESPTGSLRVGHRSRLTRRALSSVVYPHTYSISSKRFTHEEGSVIQEAQTIIRDIRSSVESNQDPLKDSVYWMAFVSEHGSHSDSTSTSDEDSAVPVYRRNLPAQRPLTKSQQIDIRHSPETQKATNSIYLKSPEKVASNRFFHQRPSVDPGGPAVIKAESGRIPPPTRFSSTTTKSVAEQYLSPLGKSGGDRVPIHEITTPRGSIGDRTERRWVDTIRWCMDIVLQE